MAFFDVPRLRSLTGMGSDLMPGEDDNTDEMLRRLRYPMAPLLPAPSAAAQPAQTTPQNWLAGGKFTGRDALGLALGAIGDAFSQHNGGQAVAMPLVLNGLLSARQARLDAAKLQPRVDALIKAGVDPARARVLAPDEEAMRQILAPEAPKPTDVQRNYEWLKATRGQAAADEYAQHFYDPTITTTLPGDRFYSGPQSGLPGALGGANGQGADIPTVTDEASYNAIAPGQQFRTPDGHVRVKGGGAGNGAGGFPAHIPSGNPLDPYPR